MDRPSDKTLVIIPTYNELENLPLIIGRLHAALPNVDVLVADDGSPDGTGELADKLAAADERGRIHVMHRTAKAGLGAAYIAGFKWGFERGYTILVEMDADGSHAPEQLHLLLEAVDEGADLALGSRYIKGGKTVNWPFSRQFISRGGNIYARIMLGVKIRDITGGFRAFRTTSLQQVDFDSIDAVGYGFQISMAFNFSQMGFTVVERPITFTEREIGESKMSGSIVKEAMLKVPVWGWQARKAKWKGRFKRLKKQKAA
ncbi:MAG: polyprenol monophosphomannose synthase [Nocardiaceae bacterium]|nr:polyprenol monophosphomannose synthase [Nocardiaceae bacterium]